MKGIEEFLPLYRRRSRWSDRMRDVEAPLFRGYVFSRFDVERRLPILLVPGVVGIVGSGKTPLPIDDAEMDALMRVAAASLAAAPWPYLRVGDRVRVDRGPLLGLEGQLVSVKKPARLVIAVTLLQRAVAVEIEEHWVTRIAGGAATDSHPRRARQVAASLQRSARAGLPVTRSA